MGVTSVPGLALERNVLRRRGIIGLAVVIIIVIVIVVIVHVWPKNNFKVTLQTTQVAAGVVAGADVRVDGYRIGQVSEVKNLGQGQLGIVMSLDKHQLKGVTSSVQANFAPGNLFGIAEVELVPQPGGDPLKDDGTITTTVPPTDNTMSNLIRQLQDLNTNALEPNVSELLNSVNNATQYFTPLINSIGTISAMITQTQKLTAAQTLPTLGSAVQGVSALLGPLMPGVRTVWGYQDGHNPALVKEFLATSAVISQQTAPDVISLLRPQNAAALSGLVPILVDILNPVIQAMPNATLNGVQFNELINRIRNAMPDTKDGPVLNLKVMLDTLHIQIPPVPTFTVIPPKTPTKPGG